MSEDKMREALNKIAAWGEGDVVTGSFDEPTAAGLAREALAASPAEKLEPVAKWIMCADKKPPENGDARKIVTLRQDGMTWVGIRAWNFQKKCWQNGNESELVVAWRDLPEPTRNFYDRGQLVDLDSHAAPPTEAKKGDQ